MQVSANALYIVMTKEESLKLLQDRREELKDWLEGTINKQYDTEETADTVREDVDRYFSDEWLGNLYEKIKND